MKLEQFAGVNAGYVSSCTSATGRTPSRSIRRRARRSKSWTPTDRAPTAGGRHAQPRRADDVCTSSSAPPTWPSRSAATAIWPRASIRSARRRSATRRCRPDAHGITDDDLKRLPASLVGGPVAESSANAYEAIEKLRRDLLLDHRLRHRARVRARRARLAAPRRRVGPLPAADGSGRAPRRCSIGSRRSRSSSGSCTARFPARRASRSKALDMLVPILDEIICGAADQGIRHTIIGMAHRGRLNVLAHVLQKPYAQILAEFKDPVQTQTLRDRSRLDGRREVPRRRAHRRRRAARCS